MSEQRAEDAIWNLMTWRRDHLDDYILIARLAEILDIAADLKEPPKPPEPGEIKLTFGKYNGKTLGEICAIEPGYLIWLADKAMDDAIRAAARQVLAAPKPPIAEEPEREADLLL